MSLAYQYTEMNGRKGFSKITKQAGRWWLKDFLKRFPEVHLKKGHNLSVNRAMCTNNPTIDKCFNLYQDLLQNLNIKSPMHIWNTDESGVQDVPKEEQVIGVTGEKAHTMSPKWKVPKCWYLKCNVKLIVQVACIVNVSTNCVKSMKLHFVLCVCVDVLYISESEV